MKYRLFLVLAGFLLLASCEQGMDTLYEPYNGVYFTGEFERGVFIPTDSMTVSFGLRDASIRFDTVRIKVSFSGRQVDRATAFKVRVIEKSESHEEFRNDMVEGVHYLPLEEYYYFEPNTYETTMNLIIDRSNFSTNYQTAEEHSIILRLEESEDFVVGVEEGREIMINVNNYLKEPAWWDLRGYYGIEGKLGFYHPEKWKALIYVNEGFGDAAELGFPSNNTVYINNLISQAAALPNWWPKVDFLPGFPAAQADAHDLLQDGTGGMKHVLRKRTT